MFDTSKNPFPALLPQEKNKYPRGLYECFPAFTLSEGEINQGYGKLAGIIQKDIPDGLRVLVIDGFQNIDWLGFKKKLSRALKRLEIKPSWLDMSNCLAEQQEIRDHIEPFLGGDDRLFGTQYPFGPEVFFNGQKVAEFRIKATIARGKKAGDLTIIYGCGSGLLELWDQLWYLDFPKDLSQIQAKKGKVINLGEREPATFELFYKRSYFVEWPALNRLKKRLLPDIGLIIDAQDIDNPSFTSGENFRSILHLLSESPFRVRPWFFPGPWGGKYMQAHMGLDYKQPNFAWSFELIVPENGIIIEKACNRLEFSFDFLMFQESSRVLGRTASNQFKFEWPIRFDYLDTIDGGNLSTQVHPKPDFIRKNFGETYTQDETYYIVAAKPDARVFIGLTDNCDQDEFRTALENSIQHGKEVDIDKFVNSEPSKPHDLFLIPNGTVHCSGAGNLVLEISATPYIFTFKIYDYLRRDLEGNLRPINIERGFKNIRFERQKKWVQENLLAKPQLLNKGRDWQEFVLYDKPFTFYKVHRVDFKSEFNTETSDKAFVVNLVEGEQVEIISENGRKTILSYLETMLIPAATGKIKLLNKGNFPCKIVMVYIKPGIGVSEALNSPQDG